MFVTCLGRVVRFTRSVWCGLLAMLAVSAVAADAPSAPSFSIPGGVYTNEVTLVLTSSDSAAVIRYTVDGSEPTASSPSYKNPVVLTNSTLIRARLFAAGKVPGELVAQSYLVLDPDVGDFTSNLPIMLVTSFGHEIQKDERIVASARITVPQGGRASLRGVADFDGRALVNLRGRASIRYAKRSYTLKTVDAQDDASKFAILGMPKESDWVLYAPYPDKTLMRDVLAYELSNRLGRWAPRTKFVELFLNESGGRISRRDYMGVYVFEEKVKRDKNRVNIAGLGPDDNAGPKRTGGYIFKKDHGEGDVGAMQIGGPAMQSASVFSKFGFPTGPGGFPGDPAGFQPSYRGKTVTSSSSSSSSSSRSSRVSRDAVMTNRVGFPTARQVSIVSRQVVRSDDEDEYVEVSDDEKYFDYFRSAQTNKFYYVDPEPDELTAVQRGWLKEYINQSEAALYGRDFRDPSKGYAAYIDADAFIDYHLLVEVTKNVDGFRFSTFYHKDRGGKIRMGPLWDWNLSFGNCNGKQGYMPEGWLWPQLDDKEYSWFRRLFEDPEFAQRYVDRWSELRATVLATTNVLGRIESIAAELGEAQERNFDRWPILGVTVSPNWFVGDTYADEVKWMKDWTSNRLAWIEQQFLTPPTISIKEGDAVSLSAGKGRILYTLDGSDPRATGGGAAPGALEYKSAFKLEAGKTLEARVSQDGRWSGLTIRRPAP